MPAKIDSGIEAETITMFRHDPRKTRIISETRMEETIASRTTFSMAERTNTDWSKSKPNSNPGGAAALISGSVERSASTTTSVEASEWRRMVT